VESAEEMFQACMEYFETSDIVVAAAAVADYSPASSHPNKLKKGDGMPQIELQETKDILAHMGANKKHQYLVGFALETTNEIAHAASKLKSKNLDLIVLNSLNDKGAGFEYDTNKVTLITKDNKKISFELKSKREVAEDIVNTILSEIDA
jgi:phosphopantothenoylcysteine decarboxylase/phosphopantothenate--cysteine ligase